MPIEPVALSEGESAPNVEIGPITRTGIVRYAGVVGKENVIAGTDCGLGQRVGHPEIAWAKLQASAEGARIASKQLWGRGD